MRLLFAVLLMHFFVSPTLSQETQNISMQGGRFFFEMVTGAQQYMPDSSAQWSFRIGGGANAVFGNIYTSGKYSIAGIRHEAGEDFPQSLVSFLRIGGGYFFQDRSARRSITPMLSVGHVSDRIMPKTGKTELQFDGWGIAPGFEARYVVHSSFDPRAKEKSSVWWSTHFVQLEMHRLLSDRAYTVASLSYNVFFDGFQLTLHTEYNTLQRGTRGWLVGLELGLSWFHYSIR